MKVYRRFRILQKQLEQVNTIICDKKKVAVASLGSGYWENDNANRSYSVNGSIHEFGEGLLNGELAKTKEIMFFANAAIPLEKTLDSLGTQMKEYGTRFEEFLLSLIELSTNEVQTFVCSSDNVLTVDSVSVIGSDIRFFIKQKDCIEISDINVRTAQVFGSKTTNILSHLTIGIVGASGTGSIIAEQLYRMNVGTMVLADNDVIEEKNLGRILNASRNDCNLQKNKAVLQKEAVERSGLNTKVIALPTVIAEENTIRCLSQCDILMGCMDSIDGRHQLNLISTYYSIPYFDVGVKLKADGMGGVEEVTTAVHYMIPGESSLFSRGIYNSQSLEAATLLRENPIEYAKRLEEKYIVGAHESNPAVIPVNMIASSMAILELLVLSDTLQSAATANYFLAIQA